MDKESFVEECLLEEDEEHEHGDWSAFPVEPLIDSQNTSTTQAWNKLQARRSKKNTNRTSEDQPQPSEFQFMPTLGVSHVNDSIFNSRPAVYSPEKNDVVEVIPHRFTEE
ncbi:hypothetical protein Fot_38278 [Forsythia ovata]|uniref:Uncharacterized protein n=1 Tax=Forsythia ovata TaxID=205694 RepID=A0ABD1S240_9LAMI